MPIILIIAFPGLLANASTLYPCRVDIPPILPCWHAARPRMVDKLAILALAHYPLHPPLLLHRRRLLPRLVKEPTILITRLLGHRECASRLSQYPADVLPILPCWHAARVRMVDRRVVLVLRRFPIHPPLLPRQLGLLPRPEKELTILITLLLGRQVYASRHFPCPVDVLPILPCWHAARPRMVDRQVAHALRRFPIHPPLLPRQRRLLPRPEKEPIIPTTRSPGRQVYVSRRFPCQVDVLPILPCWHAARPRMVDRQVVLALLPFPIHPPLLPRRPAHLPRPERELTTRTTHLLGPKACASPHFLSQADVLPTLPCWHAARLPMADRPATNALRRCPIHPRQLLPRFHQTFTTPTTRLLGRQENASTHCPFPVVALPTRVNWHAARPHMQVR